jgi:hypothetical protein
MTLLLAGVGVLGAGINAAGPGESELDRSLRRLYKWGAAGPGRCHEVHQVRELFLLCLLLSLAPGHPRPNISSDAQMALNSKTGAPPSSYGQRSTNLSRTSIRPTTGTGTSSSSATMSNVTATRGTSVDEAGRDPDDR